MTVLPFATRVICYCLSQRGSISLRGQKRRPWLRLRRTELEKTYLDHQVRQLRKLNRGDGFKAHWSRISVDSIYDDLQVEFTTDDLWPAYRLLYPRDQRRVTPEAFAAAGRPGLAAAFLDSGIRKAQSARLRFYGPMPAPSFLSDWLEDLDVPGRLRWFPGGSVAMEWNEEQSKSLVRAIRPLTHRSMAHYLAKPRPRTGTFYAGR
jgi:hypothetical protein